MLAFTMQPVHITDGLFESTVYRAQEVVFINSDYPEYVIDIGNSGLADTNARHVRRLNQANFRSLATCAV